MLRNRRGRADVPSGATGGPTRVNGLRARWLSQWVPYRAHTETHLTPTVHQKSAAAVGRFPRRFEPSGL